MSVRKRTWTTRLGERRESWVVDYVDQHRRRHIRTFERRKDAEDYRSSVRVDVKAGTHTAPSRSLTVAQAAEDWLAACGGEKLERATLAYYRQHVAHLAPLVGQHKLSALTTPGVHKFRDALLERLSRPLAKKVLTSLKAILKDAQRRGNVAQNVARDVRIGQSGRAEAKLAVGVDRHRHPARRPDQARADPDRHPRGRGRCRRAGQVHRYALAAAFLRFEMHQLARRWRPCRNASGIPASL